MKPTNPAFIWTDTHGKGRNRYALFRCVFDLSDVQTSDRTLHIFADTRYRLIVNGQTLGHGPARFFVSSPEFDSYDLTNHLRPGKNAVAIIVNSCGAVSFHSDLSTGGLCVWGIVNADGNEWKAIDSPGHTAETHYLSFALNPAEHLDAAAMPAGWELAEFDDSAWKQAVFRQDCKWGELRPRSIPMLDESPVHPTRQLGSWAATPAVDEDIYSLFVTTGGGKSLHTQARVAVLAYLDSPRDQSITLGSWWGKHWLNGEELKGQNRNDLCMRQDFPCHLKQGRNVLVVYEKLGYDFFDFTLGMPKLAEVDVRLFVGGPWDNESVEVADKVQWPTENLPAELGRWKPWPREKQSPFPMKHRGWKSFTPFPSATPTSSLSLLYEFPGEVIGRPLLDFTAAPGTLVDLFYTERLKPDGTADVHAQPWGIHMADRYLAKSGRQQIHTFHPRGFKYLEVFVTGDLSKFDLHELAVTRANYPVDFVGEFECSDPMLQKIWVMGRDTQHACMEDASIDCPWRERGLYAGDMLVQFAVTLACFGDDRGLLLRCINLFLQSQDETGLIAGGAFGLPAGRHPDYSAIVLISIHDYWIRNGEIKSILPMIPQITRLAAGLANLKSTDDVLLDGSNLSPYIDNCHMDKGGINCALNCFYQGAFHCVAKIFSLTGGDALSSKYTTLANQLATAIRDTFWDETRGIFTDQAGTDPSIPANTLPLLWDVASPAQAQRALPWLMDAMKNNFRVPDPKRAEDLNVNAYFSFYALAVLYKFDKPIEAESFMRFHWGMMIDAGAWTCWEFFTDNHSRCHAWSASPTHFLSTQVLGISFPEAGNINKIKIDPKPGNLTWARGIYPHPAGPIRISWQRDGNSVRIQHEAPPCVVVEEIE